jgi:hypothetical protein
MDPLVNMPMPIFPFPQSVRVALLVCNEPLFNFINDTTYEIYRKWLVESLPPGSEFKLKMKPYNVYKEEYPTSKEIRKFFDVIMLTGSGMHRASFSIHALNIDMTYPQRRMLLDRIVGYVALYVMSNTYTISYHISEFLVGISNFPSTIPFTLL